MRLYDIAGYLIKAGVYLRDADALLSRDPDRIKRRIVNRLIAMGVRDSTRNLYQRPPRLWKRRKP